MSRNLQSLSSSDYERPGQAWVCGHAGVGNPCPLGPNGMGVCGATSECAPRLIDDRWTCNRPAHRGGACEDGPDPNGECACSHEPCSPQRSLRSKRGIFTLCCTALTIGLLTIVLNSSWRRAVVAPGTLTKNHMSLVAGADAKKKCANCHAAGDEDTFTWLLDTCTGGRCTSTPQSSLCMKCHEQTITPDHALRPHTVSADVLQQLTLVIARDKGDGTPATNNNGELACATCHKEHHGSEHDLTALTNKQCQTCHSQHFHSFAHGHPDFKNWPQKKHSAIRFDHVRHRDKHFVEWPGSLWKNFMCAACHRPSETGEITSVVDYKQACASCHDKQMQDRDAEGFVLLQLPMIDDIALEDAGINVGDWPEDCKGDFDGPLPPLMRLLLTSDPRAHQALATFASDFEFADIDPDDPTHVRAAADLIWSIKYLMNDLSTRGQAAIQDRAEVALGTKLTPQQVGRLSGQLPADLLLDMQNAWLPQLHHEIQLQRQGQWPPLAGRVSYEEDVPAPATEMRRERSTSMPKPQPRPQDVDENRLRIAQLPLHQGEGRGEGVAPKLSSPIAEPASPHPNPLPRGEGIPNSLDASVPLLAQDRVAERQPSETAFQKLDRSNLGRPNERVAGGGWFRDDATFAIAFRPSGHADAFFTAWLDAAQSLKQRQSKPTSESPQPIVDHTTLQNIGNCASCHDLDANAGTGQSLWMADRRPALKSFTRFSHRPHLTGNTFACFDCHQMDESTALTIDPLSKNHPRSISNFHAITKASCIKCHTPHGSGDGCLKCHNYHVSEDRTTP